MDDAKAGVFASKFDALKRLSAELGRDPTRTQAAGGNTSLKHDGIMWTKASGTWLAEAEQRDIFVPVRIDPLLDALHAGDPRAEKGTDFIATELSSTCLRPSIETTVHAVFPQAVVLHIHCVNTIAAAVRREGEAVLRAMLGKAGLAERFAYIPYCRPGVPLAHEIEKVTGQQTDIVVLENHGLIVAGNSVSDASALLDAVIAAIAHQPRDIGAEADIAALARLAEGTGYRLPGAKAVHHLARDSASLRVATAGALYPDHVIFLGEEVAAIEPTDDAMRSFLAGSNAGCDSLPPLLLVKGLGVLVRETLTASGEALVGCLSDVAARIPADAPLKPLTAEEIYALTHWEAESYRQSLDRKAAAQ
ncbi:class II aldolase/adducin family protein [Jiella marina]|uniref:class II aldolase/adducin family protein n=1 Tax=Jiella sp. LLJ827 TaxID=2917712 RepID=UPI002101AA81|nr:class II aldolase/adducin family protein [Jiella sp. LLJ827]MCQ0987887.1 class II aldolase/adducin family protein [Jiella sp. LLJ827]